MRRDELKQPLRKRSLATRLWAKRPSLLFAAYVLTGAGFGGASWWAVQQPMPNAGEPIFTVSIPVAEEIVTASVKPVEEVAEAPIPTVDEELPVDPVAQAAEPGYEPTAEDTAAADAALKDEDRTQYVKTDDVVIVQSRRSLPLAPINEITETTTWGALPKISAGGDKPSKVYARSASLNTLHSDAPKIAIILGGLGLNKKLTQKAIKDLPADVTLAFAPYGNDLQEQVNKARKEGHEIFLQLPLEPIGYPAANPGPRTLLGEATEAENIDAMRWHMSRFAGYAGIINYMGGRFLSMPKALKPMFGELKKRGLLFVEDGSLALSATENTGKNSNLQVRRAKVVIDSEPTRQGITAALDLLEQEARDNGFAVGSGSGLEVTIDTLADWAKEANERGVILVPVTATFKGRLG
jgi:uncharacterized protein